MRLLASKKTGANIALGSEEVDITDLVAVMFAVLVHRDVWDILRNVYIVARHDNIRIRIMSPQSHDSGQGS